MEIQYIESWDVKSDIRKFISNLDSKKIKEIVCFNPEDNYLERRIKESCDKKGLKVKFYDNPLFLNNRENLKAFFRSDKKKLFQTSFYKSERLKLRILLDENKNPLGGKWTYDDMNREKYPKNKRTPKIEFSEKTNNHEQALIYVERYFKNNHGIINNEFIYPTDFSTSKAWLLQFLKTRFDEFGPYEDAILKEESIINHSVLSPLINSGLITPTFVVQSILDFFTKNIIFV